MALSRGEHQGCLMVLIEGRIGIFMASFDEDDADIPIAKRGSEMEVGVR